MTNNPEDPIFNIDKIKEDLERKKMQSPRVLTPGQRRNIPNFVGWGWVTVPPISFTLGILVGYLLW